MNDKKRLLLLCGIIFVMSGCTQRQIVSNKDELMAFSWQNTDKYCKSVKLDFKDNYAELTVMSYNFRTRIYGKVITDNQSFSIYDNSLGKIFHFNYQLSGNKTKLFYQGKEIKLDKI